MVRAQKEGEFHSTDSELLSIARFLNHARLSLAFTAKTGASGKTGSCIAARLTQFQHPVRLAGRSNSTNLPGSDHVHFDWYDESTHTKALTNVDKVYLVVPVKDINPAKVMILFIEKAIHEGVKRFVLLGSASVPADGPVFGPVHQALSKARLDRRIRENGSEDQVTDIVERVTGRSPISVEQFVQTHVGTWK
ncbi:UNVERIFIED_CONTAM: hypothetical protein ABIC26_004826 [Paenibacillus sp. PvR008]